MKGEEKSCGDERLGEQRKTTWLPGVVPEVTTWSSTRSHTPEEREEEDRDRRQPESRSRFGVLTQLAHWQPEACGECSAK
eukprot:2599109-Rhodomonas_salina.2